MTNSIDGSRIDASAKEIAIELDSTIYRLSAVKKAAYKFGNHFHVKLLPTTGQWVRVVLTPKAPTDTLDHWAGEFCNEVLDQELREVVAQETEPVKNLLLAQAFSATSLLDPAGEEGDYRLDPLGIRQPYSQSADQSDRDAVIKD
jgi:His-Xaa-Ser system protein HxsD